MDVNLNLFDKYSRWNRNFLDFHNTEDQRPKPSLSLHILLWQKIFNFMLLNTNGPLTSLWAGWSEIDNLKRWPDTHTRKFPLVCIFFLLSHNTDAVRYRSKIIFHNINSCQWHVQIRSVAISVVSSKVSVFCLR